MCEQEENVQSIKCMLVGDSLTGKTHIFKTFISQPIPTEYLPTVFDISNLHVESKNGHQLLLNLWDSAGSNVYDSIRPISYAHTDCFIVCYSVQNKDSFENICERWVPEIIKHGDGPHVPIVIVATNVLEKGDIEQNGVEDEEDCKALRGKIGAKAYFSISLSSKLQQNVNEILQTAIDFAYAKKLEDEKPADPVWKFCSPTVAFMGEVGTGITSLISACMENKVEPPNSCTKQSKNKIMEQYYHRLVQDGCEYFLRFVEVTSDIEISEMDKVDVLVLCYSVIDPFTFQTVELTLQRIQKHLQCPVILVGTKNDLSNDSLCSIPKMDGEFLKQKMGCACFIECSAKTLENISQLRQAILESVEPVVQ